MKNIQQQQQHLIVEFREGFNAFKGGTIYQEVVIGTPQDERYTECESNSELSYRELSTEEVEHFIETRDKKYTIEIVDGDAKVYHPINKLKNFKELYNE